jgi:hypothetical protein
VPSGCGVAKGCSNFHGGDAERRLEHEQHRDEKQSAMDHLQGTAETRDWLIVGYLRRRYRDKAIQHTTTTVNGSDVDSRTAAECGHMTGAKLFASGDADV